MGVEAGLRSMKQLLLLLLTVCTATAAGLPYHPYRKVADRYYSLVPIYTWASQKQVPEKRLTPQQRYQIRKRPMPEWIGYRDSTPNPKLIGMPSYTDYKVVRVLNDGLLIERRATITEHTQSEDYSSYSKLVLKNFPDQKSMVDGQQIEFLALKIGTYKLGTETLEVYDYGIPYNPVEKQRTAEKQKASTAVEQ